MPVDWKKSQGVGTFLPMMNLNLEAKQPAIAHTLPLHNEPYVSDHGLHSFFGNLVAEGWFQKAQARALGVAPSNHFALLLGFGHDLAGAVSVVDPNPQEHHKLDHTDEKTLAALLSRASLSRAFSASYWLSKRVRHSAR